MVLQGLRRGWSSSIQSDRDLAEDMSQERESLHQLKTPRTFGWLVGGCITFVAVVGVLSSGQNRWLKNFSVGWMYGGVAILVSNEGLAVLYSRRAKEYVDQELAEIPRSNSKIQQWQTYHQQQAHQWQSQHQQQGQYIASLQQQIQSLIDQHETDQNCIEEAIAHSSQLESFQEKQELTHQKAIAQLTRDIEKSGDRLETLQTAHQQALQGVTAHAKHTIYQIMHEWQKRLFALLDNARIQQNPIPELKELHDLLKQVEDNNKHKIDGYNPAVSTVSNSSHTGTINLNLVMDELLSLLHFAGRDYAELHAKIQLATNSGSNLAALHNSQSECDRLLAQNQGLTKQLSTIKSQDLVPRALMQQHLEELQTKLQTKHQGIITQLQQQLQTLANDSSTDQVAQQAVSRLEKLEAINKALQARVEELSAPILYRPANREDQRMSNAIAQYFQAQGLILDRAYSDYQKWRAALYFHIDRNPQIVLDSQLNEHSEKLTQLTNSLTDPEFTFDKSQGLMKATVQLSAKPPVGSSEIDKIWKSVDQFEALVSKIPPRIRVTGGSEGGKSPTAENIAVCILKAKKRAGIPYRVRVANPQFHSKKNHWSLPQHWKSHEESLQGLKEMKSHLDARSNNQQSQDLFDLYLFDETDSTITEYGRTVTDLIFYCIKQASHQDLGMFFIGQSPNASNYKSQKADWENATSFHIGSAAKHAIEKDDGLPSEEKNLLKKQWEILNEYCQQQNKKLGLITTGNNQSAEGYRFAWVQSPQGHYWIELPAFGRYTFDQINTVETDRQPSASHAATVQPRAAESSADPVKPDSAVAAEAPAPTYLGKRCKKCNYGTFMSAKKSRGVFYYLCGECGKSTSENVLARHYPPENPSQDQNQTDE